MAGNLALGQITARSRTCPLSPNNQMPRSIICEGEKAADAASLIFPESIAATSSGGAGAAAKTDWTPLAGRLVLIWPDADAAGEKYAREVAAKLKMFDCSVSIIDAKGLASIDPGGGARDPENGWDAADAIGEYGDAGSISNAIKGAASENYGMVGPEFVRQVVQYGVDSVADDCRAAVAAFVEANVSAVSASSASVKGAKASKGLSIAVWRTPSPPTCINKPLNVKLYVSLTHGCPNICPNLSADEVADALRGQGRSKPRDPRILSPKPDDRHDALEKLWNAFERLKTPEPTANKRAQADAPLDWVATPLRDFGSYWRARRPN
jgi:hypothetical protein